MSQIYIFITSILLIAYYIKIYIKARKSPKRYKLALINLFDDGIDGFGQLVGFCLVHILYVGSWFIWSIFFAW